MKALVAAAIVAAFFLPATAHASIPQYGIGIDPLMGGFTPAPDAPPAPERVTQRTTARPRGISVGASVERWRPLAERHFPPDAVDEALLCVHLESRGDPNAVNGQYAGLFQFGEAWGGDERFDPEWAFRAAWKAYAESGWKHWPPMKKRGY